MKFLHRYEIFPRTRIKTFPSHTYEVILTHVYIMYSYTDIKFLHGYKILTWI
jgi:hypothetical protein